MPLLVRSKASFIFCKADHHHRDCNVYNLFLEIIPLILGFDLFDTHTLLLEMKIKQKKFYFRPSIGWTRIRGTICELISSYKEILCYNDISVVGMDKGYITNRLGFIPISSHEKWKIQHYFHPCNWLIIVAWEWMLTSKDTQPAFENDVLWKFYVCVSSHCIHTISIACKNFPESSH